MSFTFKQSSTAEEETKFPQLKVFAEDCLLRFYKMKLRKENQLQEKGKFVNTHNILIFLLITTLGYRKIFNR